MFVIIERGVVGVVPLVLAVEELLQSVDLHQLLVALDLVDEYGQAGRAHPQVKHAHWKHVYGG